MINLMSENLNQTNLDNQTILDNYKIWTLLNIKFPIESCINNEFNSNISKVMVNLKSENLLTLVIHSL